MTPEEKKEYNKKYYQKNKDKHKSNVKQYKTDNKDKVKEVNKKYYQTPEGKKSQRISNWKKMGVFHDDYNQLYKEYIETERCDRCGVYLTEDKRKTKTTRCLDHDHNTGFVRNIVCQSCNVKIG